MCRYKWSYERGVDLHLPGKYKEGMCQKKIVLKRSGESSFDRQHKGECVRACGLTKEGWVFICRNKGEYVSTSGLKCLSPDFKH